MKNFNLEIVFLLLERGVELKYMSEEQKKMMDREELLKDVVNKFRKVGYKGELLIKMRLILL